MSGTLTPSPWLQFEDANGVPYSGGKLYTYQAGTTTLADTWFESDLAPAHKNTNPIILDSAGRCVIYLAAASYKYVLYTSANVLVKTQDNVASTALVQGIVGASAFCFGGDSNSPITSSTYASGATFDKCAPGTGWLYIDSDALGTGTFALEGMMSSSAGTMTAALVNLSDGSPNTAIVEISSSSTTGDRQRSSAITFAAGGTSKIYAIKTKNSSGYGLGWEFQLVRLS